MGVFDIGGGGSPSGSVSASTEFALDRPYDLTGFSPEMLDQLNEMLQMLFNACKKASDKLTTDASLITTLQSNVATLQAGSGTTNSNILTKSFTLTGTDVSAMNNGGGTAVPIDIVPAPGTGLILMPMYWSINTFRGANNVTSWSGSPSWRCRWKTGTADLLSTIGSGLANAGTSNREYGSGGYTGPTGVATSSFDPRNLSLQISPSSTFATIGDAPISINGYIWYVVSTMP